jgi:hypothetical protein
MIIESEIRNRVEFVALKPGESFMYLGYLYMKTSDWNGINLSSGELFEIKEHTLVVPLGNITKVSTL